MLKEKKLRLKFDKLAELEREGSGIGENTCEPLSFKSGSSLNEEPIRVLQDADATHNLFSSSRVEPEQLNGELVGTSKVLSPAVAELFIVVAEPETPQGKANIRTAISQDFSENYDCTHLTLGRGDGVYVAKLVNVVTRASNKQLLEAEGREKELKEGDNPE